MRYLFICFLTLICTHNHAQTLSGFAKTADSLCTVGTNLFKQSKSQESASALEAARIAALKAAPLDSVMYANILHYLGAPTPMLFLWMFGKIKPTRWKKNWPGS